MIKSILVPVDGSEHSVKALTLAVDIAEKYDATLSVLFVASHKINEDLRHYKALEFNSKDEGDVSEQIGKSTINRMINKLKTNVVIKPVVLFRNLRLFASIKTNDMIKLGDFPRLTVTQDRIFQLVNIMQEVISSRIGSRIGDFLLVGAIPTQWDLPFFVFLNEK